MMDILGTVLGAVFSGGATGLLGVIVQRWFDHKAKEQEIEVVKLQLANAVELSKLETERTTRVAEIEMEGKFAEADASTMQASFKHDSATYVSQDAQKRKGFVGGLVLFMMASVDFLRGILRPGMTAYLCALVTVMFFWVRDLADKAGIGLTGDQAFQLMLQIIVTILYVFTTCATWWFGARPPKQKNDA